MSRPAAPSFLHLDLIWVNSGTRISYQIQTKGFYVAK